jgi:hypothetical protein
MIDNVQLRGRIARCGIRNDVRGVWGETDKGRRSGVGR